MKRHIYNSILLSLLLTVSSLTIFGQNTASSSTPTVDPLQPDIPSVSNGYTVGSIAGGLTVNGMGAAEYNLPIECPNGGSLNPQIALVYNSQNAGYGLAGYSFSVSGVSAITRGKKDMFHNGEVSGVTYTSNDNLFLDGKRLILQSGTACQDGAVYCLEGNPYTKVVVHGTYSDNTANTWFEVNTQNGKTYQYGNLDNSSNARISYKNKKGNARIASWYLNRIDDVYGNYMLYQYSVSNLYAYVSTITYGLNKNKNRGIVNKIAFEYKSLGSNQSLFHIEDQEGKIDRCISSITTSCNDTIYRKYLLTYDGTSDQSMCKYTRLVKIEEQNGAGERLPPTKFSWNFLPGKTLANYPIDVTDDKDGSIIEAEHLFHAVDLNGDGLSDIVKISIGRILNDDGYLTNGGLVNYWTSHLERNGLLTFQRSGPFKIYGFAAMDGIRRILQGSSAADLDGDGCNDLIVPLQNQNDNSYNQELFYLFFGCRDGERRNTDSQGLFWIDLNAGVEAPLVAPFDIDGDGREEIVCVDKNGNNGRYTVSTLKISDDQTRFDRKDFSISVQSVPKKIFIADYNNDGLTDFILLSDAGYKIFYNNGGVEPAQRFSDLNSKTGTEFGECWRIQQGDFDGDGLIDFVFNVSGESRLWIARNNGDGTFELRTTEILGVHDYTETKKDNNEFSLLVCDYDHDGKSDAMVCKSKYDKLGEWYEEDYYKYNSTIVRWLHSDGTTLHLTQSFENNHVEDSNESSIFTGDFDGDGYLEIANYGNDLTNPNNLHQEDKLNVYKVSPDMSQTGRITHIVDGMGRSSDVSYAPATSAEVYTRTRVWRRPNEYPVNTYALPVSVVKSVTSSNGVAGSQTLEYGYKDLKVHVRGAGVLGFSETSVTDAKTGERTTSAITKWDQNRWVPIGVKVIKTQGDDYIRKDSIISESNSAVVDVNNTYFVYEQSSKLTDLYGDTALTVNEYQIDTDKAVLSRQKVLNYGDVMYKEVTYSDYVNKSGMWFPTLMTMSQKHSDDRSSTPYSSKTKYTYDDKGNVLTRIENYNTPMALETISTYDEYGNCLSSTSKGKGITGVREVTSYNDYDPSGRFVVKSYQEPAAAANTFTYDIWGHVLTESDETEPTNILTTSHTYDKWGRLVSSIAPDGTMTETITGWGNSDEKKYYTLEKKSETPWVLTWYDNVGHEVLQQTFGPKNVLISKATEYNERGQVKKVTSTNGKLSAYETFAYDDQGRVVSDKHSSGKEITYTYDKRSVTTTINGRSTTKTTDAWGNVKTSTDAAGNSVRYVYKSNGKPAKITTNGTTVTMEYDEAGNQKKLTDPDAGTTTYEYAADGMLLKQTDAKGIETENIYDKYGRLTRTNVGGSSISTAIRRSYGSSGNEKLRLRMLRLGMQNYIRYTHDKYGRVITEERYIDRKETFYTHYEYDDRNRLSKVTYPGNLEVEYQYDDYGHVTKMKADGKEVYQLTSYNGLSTTTSFRNGISLTRTRDANGYESLAELTKLHLEQYADSAKVPIDGPILDPIIGPNINSIQTNGVTIGGRPSIGGGGSYFEDRFLKVLDRHDVNYDPLTDNLLARKRYGRSVEAFGYDNLDRLTSVSTSTATTVTGTGALTEVMGITYAPNGNILSKTGVGDYTYNSSVKPHAVMSVDNTDGLIPSNALSTTFNIYGMISTIEDEDSDRIMSFSYGPDLQRSSTTMSKNGQDERKTVYVGNYERITEDGVTREFYYLDGGVIIIKQDGEFKPYQAFTDNLGSILSVVDENGEKVFDASYDAWGCQTVTLNEIGLHRGYTGHEMLNEFGIINMNGRLYDPVLGRFFSPDNYVQLPDNSQNFNRYSYCLNNPLKYTDPSGELFGIDDVILLGVAYGMYTSALTAWGNGENPWKAAGLSLLSSAFSYGIGELFGPTGNFGKEILRAGAHGLSGGVISVLNGEPFEDGLISGIVASSLASGCQALHMDQRAMVPLAAVMGGIAAWLVGGDFLQGALQGMQIAVLNHCLHDDPPTSDNQQGHENFVNVLPEIVITGRQQQLLATRIEYIGTINTHKNKYRSTGTYAMYYGDKQVFSCRAVSGAANKKSYTIPEGDWNVISIRDRHEERFTSNGVGFTANLDPDPFYDDRAGKDREYIRIHPARSEGTNGCIGLRADKAQLIRARDIIGNSLKKGLTIKLHVQIIVK